MLLGEHILIATAAMELISKMSGMPLLEYGAFAIKLDESRIDYPPSFCVQCLLYTARAKQQQSNTCSPELADMFSLKAQPVTGHQFFRASAPRLQNITPLVAGDLEKALVDGLFGTVMLHNLDRPDGVQAVIAAAETLRDACVAATSMALASDVSAPTTVPSIVAGPRKAAGRSVTSSPGFGWLSDMSDVACAVLCVVNAQPSQADMDTLLNVQESRAGCSRILSAHFKKEPWMTMVKETWKFGLSTSTIVPQINAAIKACATDPEAWTKAATQVPLWAGEVRPGTTAELEDVLWRVLLAAWDNFDADDKVGSTKLLARLRLARVLESPHKPDAATIDQVEKDAPEPQQSVPAQTCWLKMQPRGCSSTCSLTMCCLSQVGRHYSG